MEERKLLIDFDIIKYTLSSRGIETRLTGEGIYSPCFNLVKSINAWKEILENITTKLADENILISECMYFYTSRETGRTDYFRTFIDHNYKIQRKKTETAFSSLFTGIIMDNLDKFVGDTDTSIPNYYGLETDDTISLTCETLGINDCIVLSSDKDFQFKYHTFNPMTMRYSEPCPYKLFELMVVGDTADNIKGIAGSGIAAYRKLEEASSSIEELSEMIKDLYLKKNLDFELTEFMLRPLEKANFEWLDQGNTFSVSTPNIGIVVDIINRDMKFLEV